MFGDLLTERMLPTRSNLQQRDDEEIEVGDPAELLEQVHWQECEHRKLGSPHTIVSRANVVPDAEIRQPTL